MIDIEPCDAIEDRIRERRLACPRTAVDQDVTALRDRVLNGMPLVSTQNTVFSVIIEPEDEQCLRAQCEGRPLDQPRDEGLEAAPIER